MITTASKAWIDCVCIAAQVGTACRSRVEMGFASALLKAHTVLYLRAQTIGGRCNWGSAPCQITGTPKGAAFSYVHSVCEDVLARR